MCSAVHIGFEVQGLKPMRGHTQQEEEEGWVKGAGPATPFEIYVCTSLHGPLDSVLALVQSYGPDELTPSLLRNVPFPSF